MLYLLFCYLFVTWNSFIWPGLVVYAHDFEFRASDAFYFFFCYWCLLSDLCLIRPFFELSISFAWFSICRWAFTIVWFVYNALLIYVIYVYIFVCIWFVWLHFCTTEKYFIFMSKVDSIGVQSKLLLSSYWIHWMMNGFCKRRTESRIK